MALHELVSSPCLFVRGKCFYVIPNSICLLVLIAHATAGTLKNKPGRLDGPKLPRDQGNANAANGM